MGCQFTANANLSDYDAAAAAVGPTTAAAYAELPVQSLAICTVFSGVGLADPLAWPLDCLKIREGKVVFVVGIIPPPQN